MYALDYYPDRTARAAGGALSRAINEKNDDELMISPNRYMERLIHATDTAIENTVLLLGKELKGQEKRKIELEPIEANLRNAYKKLTGQEPKATYSGSQRAVKAPRYGSLFA